MSPRLSNFAPRKVVLAAMDWSATPRATAPIHARTYHDHGFGPFLADAASAADAEGYDTVVYALWSRDMSPLHEALVFRTTTKVQTAVLQVLDGQDARIEVW